MHIYRPHSTSPDHPPQLPAYRDLLQSTLERYKADQNPDKSAKIYLLELINKVLKPLVDHPYITTELYNQRTPEEFQNCFKVVRDIYAVLQLQENYDRILQQPDLDNELRLAPYSPLSLSFTIPGQPKPILVSEGAQKDQEMHVNFYLSWLVDVMKKNHLKIAAVSHEKPTLSIRKAVDYIKRNRTYTLVDADTIINTKLVPELKTFESYVLCFMPGAAVSTDILCRVVLIHPKDYEQFELGQRQELSRVQINDSTHFTATLGKGIQMFLMADGSLIPPPHKSIDLSPQFYAGLGSVLPHIARIILFYYGKLLLHERYFPEFAETLDIDYTATQKRTNTHELRNSTLREKTVLTMAREPFLDLPRSGEKVSDPESSGKMSSYEKKERKIAGHTRLLPHGFRPGKNSLFQADQEGIQLFVEIHVYDTAEKVQLTRHEFAIWLEKWGITEKDCEELGRVYFETFVKTHKRKIGKSEYEAYKF
ncbi:hypothetical protein COW46_01360 [Candidatus Gracilibacteria bacterium CG17_big_fil_post_rev_8_21_14_2_50_48_13]|nr:MAG: hypothetical protein COW46_01360 [Candidatus Gracilibacteria bacterium CG17_big_fil_post_rev_8_21_14_2_50_48_13]